MKKIIATALLTLVCLLGSSQNSNIKPSRQETEVWVIEKINKYIGKEKYHSMDLLDEKVSTSNKNIRFNLNEENFVITSDVTKYTSNRYMSDEFKSKTSVYTQSITIPLKNITNKNFIKDGYIVFESNYISFITKHSDGYSSTNNWFGTKINANEEENFAERFNKAMNHLLSFIKKSKTSEIF
jgi:hypothetical protein